MRTCSLLIVMLVLFAVVSCAYAQAPTPPPPPDNPGGSAVANATADPVVTPPVPAGPRAPSLAELSLAGADDAPPSDTDLIHRAAEEAARQLKLAQDKLQVAGKQMGNLREENAKLRNRPTTVVRQSQTVRNITVRPVSVIQKDCGAIWSCLSYWIHKMGDQIAELGSKVAEMAKQIAGHESRIKALEDKVGITPPAVGTAPGTAPAPTPAPQVPGAAPTTPAAPAATSPATTPAPQAVAGAMVDQQARDAAKAALDAANAAKTAAAGAQFTADEAKAAASAATSAATDAANAAATAANATTKLADTVKEESTYTRAFLRCHGTWLLIIGLLAALALGAWGFHIIRGRQ